MTRATSTYNFNLFERLNSGGVTLTDQEIRSCIYRGQFNSTLRDLAQNHDFQKVVRLPTQHESDGSREELVLRFFAYLFNYQKFQHIVKAFLNDYMAEATKSFNYVGNTKLFEEVFSRLAMIFPSGLTRGRTKTTPYNLYEAVAVGAALAWKESGRLGARDVKAWIDDPQLRKLTTGATNSRPMVTGRITFCKDRFLGL